MITMTKLIAHKMPGMKKKYTGLLYVLPWLIGFLAFELYPFFASLYYSFTNYSMLKEPSFVGLQNYINIFTKDPDFANSLKVTLTYVGVEVPAKIIFALAIALILNQSIRGINFYRTVYYLPSILGGSVAVSIMWRTLFMHDGLINKLLGYFSIRPVDWLGNPGIALYTVSLLGIWQFGSSMVIFLAGLKQIPLELYEAAKVDGASVPRRFFIITVPILTPLIFFNLVMQIISAFQAFTPAFVITNGGPLKSTYLYGLLLYQNGFGFFKMGYASALSWVLFLIIMAFTLLVFKSSPLWIHYEDGGDF